MNEKNIPTIEEFTELVKQRLISLNKGVAPESTEAYLNGEEAQTEIKQAYRSGRIQLEAGEITENVFRAGCVSGVVHTLFLLYE